MKAILIATDFSEAANNAASYGVELAKALNATAILFNACEQSPVAFSTTPFPLTRREVEDNVQQHLADDTRLLTSLHEWPVLTCYKTGNTNHAFREAIESFKAELVIVGMKKDRTGVQRVLGSTVTGLIGQLETPLLVVPEEIKFTYLLNIAVALNWDILPDDNMHSLDVLRELTERFHSKLYFVQVTRSRLPGPNQPLNHPSQLAWITQKLNTEFERVTGKDIPASLSKFVQYYNIDLLVVLAHKQSLFKRFLFKSNSRTLAFECPVPLLVLQEKVTDAVHGKNAEDHELPDNNK